MKTLDLVQGSPEWLAARRQYRTASEAPAMMSASRFQTRSELLHQKASGIAPEVNSATQALFDRGHDTEAAARTIIEELIGDDLYPATVTDDAGYLLASLDGITMGGDVVYEHKLWSGALAERVRANDLEPHYYWQLEQELLVTGAEKVIFVCSDGTGDNLVSMEYRPVPGRAAQLLAGWKQFDEDLANLKPKTVTEVVMAKPKASLPAVVVKTGGALTVESNLPQFDTALRAYIADIPAKPSTDQEFADAEAACKALKTAEDALDSAVEAGVAQFTDFEAMKRFALDLKTLARSTRLAKEKQVAARKEEIRGEVVKRGADALKVHIVGLNNRLGRAYMPVIACDFAGVIRSKRTVESLNDAIDSELARAKIAANEVADRIQANMRTLSDVSDYSLLFADDSQLVLKAPEDLQAIVTTRIAAHKAAEEKRVEAAKAVPVAAAPVAAPAPAVVQMVPRAAAPVAAPLTAPTLRLGQINERIAPLSITAAGLEQLGFKAAGRQQSAVLYHEQDYPHMLARMVKHIEALSAQQAA